jgi:integrase
MDATRIVLGAVTHAMRHTMITLAHAESHDLAARALTGQKAERGMLRDSVGHATVEMTERALHPTENRPRLEQTL